MANAAAIRAAALAAVCSAVPAHAQEAHDAAVTITGSATVATDYRFRGLSQTDKRAAVQAGVTASHRSGLYASFWGSSIDDYVAEGADAEVYLSVGYRRDLGGVELDGGLLYYDYPGSDGADTDFFEPYVSASRRFGAVDVKVGGNFAWKQHGLSTPARTRAGGAYAYGEASVEIPSTSAKLTGHLGRSFVDNYVTFASHYTDWSLVASCAVEAFTLSVGYVDTDHDFPSYPLGGGRNRDVASGGLLASVSAAF